MRALTLCHWTEAEREDKDLMTQVITYLALKLRDLRCAVVALDTDSWFRGSECGDCGGYVFTSSRDEDEEAVPGGSNLSESLNKEGGGKKSVKISLLNLQTLNTTLYLNCDTYITYKQLLQHSMYHSCKHLFSFPIILFQQLTVTLLDVYCPSVSHISALSYQ